MLYRPGKSDAQRGSELNTITVTWSMPIGLAGCDASPANPLSRALNQLLREGKPFGRLCQCFFTDTRGTVRWLGVFVHSAGGRVVFFPGFADAMDKIQVSKDGIEPRQQDFAFDHATLESDRRTWHVTSAGSKHHLGRPPTLALGGGGVLWFGLTLADASALRAAHQETLVTAEVPASDGRRRMEIFLAARDGAQYPMLLFNTECITPASSLCHFAVYVEPTGFANCAGADLGAPHGSPFVSPPLPDKIANLPMRTHRVALSDTLDIQITTTILPGQLNVPVSLTGRALK
ncbi:MAG: hypothetical protein KGN16_20095 [Burkholderiales bacterium]|nr:hypothetical protein [Burkholderiales bacterium]